MKMAKTMEKLNMTWHEEKDQLEDEEGYQKGPLSKSEEQDCQYNIYSYIIRNGSVGLTPWYRKHKIWGSGYWLLSVLKHIIA